MAPSSALPPFYWFVFGLYEPFLTFCGFLGALRDPKTVSRYRNDVRKTELTPAADSRPAGTVARWRTTGRTAAGYACHHPPAGTCRRSLGPAESLRPCGLPQAPLCPTCAAGEDRPRAAHTLTSGGLSTHWNHVVGAWRQEVGCLQLGRDPMDHYSDRIQSDDPKDNMAYGDWSLCGQERSYHSKAGLTLWGFHIYKGYIDI